MICLFLPLWGCSDSTNGDDPSKDPIRNFRTFSVDLRELVHQEFLKAGVEYAALPGDLPDDDEQKVSYNNVTEDLYIQFRYITFICNSVIHFGIESKNGNTYTNEEGDGTVSITDGIYKLESDYFMPLADSWEKVSVTFTWNPATSRWLITGERINVPSGEDEEPVPWLRQEGEWTNDITAYSATTFYIEEEVTAEEDAPLRHVSNTLFSYEDTENTLQAASEREECTENCVDIITTPLYDQGIVTLEFTGWDNFKKYRVVDEAPDYEMPMPVVEVK